ncbi:MAG: toll/interleukin-1 receptor domain-containing protein [Flavobacteriaceae bacterium]|nr:toll/interleukin-1 receptor domain-containing protein [Flavobacteriaceae bacterium]
MNKKRETVFISHATPEDNDFTIWLASRLELLGYDVWIDKNKLIGGETFWKEIDSAIRNDTIKFLLVYSKNICYNHEAGNIKNGINNEIELAKSIGFENNFKDFIIPLKIDNSPHNLFVGANVLNHIDFSKGWGEGFKLLTKKLNTDSIPKKSTSEISFKDWFETSYTSSNGILRKEEFYISSSWGFASLPDKFYLIQYRNRKQANLVLENYQFPCHLTGNVIASFSKKYPTKFNIDGKILEVFPIKEFEIPLTDIVYGNGSVQFPKIIDKINLYKSLITTCVHKIFHNRGLKVYSFSNKKSAYFFTPGILENDKVKFLFPVTEKVKNIQVLGKHLDQMWHFALSIRPRVNPYFQISIYNHLIFTTNGFNPLDSNKKIQSNRRQKGKRMFNKQWRDLVLAYIQGLKDEENQIKLNVAKNEYVIMDEYPKILNSQFGYNEPSS